MSEAEGVAKRAEEELAVAKERLLLQEDELQSRAGGLLVSSYLSEGVGSQKNKCIHYSFTSRCYTENATNALCSSSTKANTFIKVSYTVSK